MSRRRSVFPLLIWLAALSLIVAPLALGWFNVELVGNWLVEFRGRQPIACAGLCCLGYAIITSTPLPFAVVASLFCGWLLGWRTGTVVVSFGSTLAATLTMMASRWLFRDIATVRLGHAVEVADRAMQRDGVVYLLLVRLMPGPPFFLVNAIFGLTNVSLRKFWVASQLGMLPATVLYVLAGSHLASMTEVRSGRLIAVDAWRFLIPLALVIALPWDVHKLFAGRRGVAQADDKPPS